jgi:hypothetical protein
MDPREKAARIQREFSNSHRLTIVVDRDGLSPTHLSPPASQSYKYIRRKARALRNRPATAFLQFAMTAVCTCVGFALLRVAVSL